MSWLLNLCKTYNANSDEVGKIYTKQNGSEYTLLPMSHTTQTAHIEVQITEDGCFHSAEIVEKGEARTIIPCTEGSASRAGSKIAPYPLHDKLNYVAGDYVAYGGTIKREEPFLTYIDHLKEWADSIHSHTKIVSICNYLDKKCLVADLVNAGILFLDKNEQLIGKWNKKYLDILKEKPKIFSVAAGGQEGAFIRFNVHSPSEQLTKVWHDKSVYDSFIQFYNDKLEQKEVGICYVNGEHTQIAEKHANKIRHSGDKAKLISANDTSGFTFRGRFRYGYEVASIGYEVSQKAHNALKWLINKQGKMIDNRVFLVWGNEELKIPNPNDDTFSFVSLDNEAKYKQTTLPEYANEISKALDGYKGNLNMKSNVNILVLDSATTGRMAVLYYRNLNKELYIDKLKDWHTGCTWLHRYHKDSNKKYVSFYGAPATKDIAFAAYGSKANEKIVKELMQRILPCVVDGRVIPVDIINSAYHRASNPVGIEKWEWEKTLSITCALINRREGLTVALNTETNNRDYLFGRLLALADVLERSALGKEETRATNAIRYMNSFSQKPERTWQTIQASLQPYQAKLGTRANYHNKMIDEVASRINIEDFNNRPLTGKFLLGFYSQRHTLYNK